MNVVERFIKYAKIDTQSRENVTSAPSTPKQFNLARQLEEECKALGLTDILVTDTCILTATLPANVEGAPVMGWIAHMDTSPELSGANVRPQFVENYDGGIIQLNESYRLDPAEFPELLDYQGQTLITTDGTTLLGADDKAGIAEIMTAVETLVNHPEIPRGTIRIAFTPDEEVGHGTDHFDVEEFGADFAYTMDGGRIGSLEYENFNAATAFVTIKGRGVHTGSAKNKMISAARLAMEFDSLLPDFDRPEYTEGYEGFFHLMRSEGTVEDAKLVYLLRDHDPDRFAWRKDFFAACAQQINRKIGMEAVSVSIHDSYQNMREKIMPHFQIVQTALDAMESLEITPYVEPIRGGTDGARLSFMGLPCPNLFTGGHNFHGRFEFIPVPSMEKASDLLVEIARLTSSRK
jgi:tripeptide aminopeptidase